MAAEDKDLQVATMKKIEAFASSLRGDVKERLQASREFRGEQEAIEKAKKLADQREREASMKQRELQEQRSLEPTKKEPVIDAGDSDLDDFIDSNPWDSAKKLVQKPDLEADTTHDKDTTVNDESMKVEELADQTSQAPKLKIQQKKLKPKGK